MFGGGWGGDSTLHIDRYSNDVFTENLIGIHKIENANEETEQKVAFVHCVTHTSSKKFDLISGIAILLKKNGRHEKKYLLFGGI